MGRQQENTKRIARRAGAISGTVTVVAAALAVFAPAAGAAGAAGGTATVGYGSCTSSNTALSAPPPDYTSQVTLTPQGSSFQAGKPITIVWHYSVSTAPAPGIPLANVATAKAKIVIGGAASSTVTTGSSANFPSAPVTVGKTFQIPDMTATFTPSAAGTYTLTPGDNEQDIAQFNLVVACKATASGPAATITVGAATGGAAPAASSTSAAPASSSPTTGVLPHTGFDGRWLAGGAVLAAALGGGSLYATRRRRGSHG